MKTLGLIGGMSWESSAIYYRLLNEGVKARLGSLSSASLLLWSLTSLRSRYYKPAATGPGYRN
jgi:aspartate/glutamate racemase